MERRRNETSERPEAPTCEFQAATLAAAPLLRQSAAMISTAFNDASRAGGGAEQPPEPVLPADAEAVKHFMAQVIGRSVTRAEPLHSELVANACGNVDLWLLQPERAVHLKVVHDGDLIGVVLVKEFWNLCSLFVAPSMQRRGIGRRMVAAAVERCRGASPRDAIWLVAAPDAAAFYRRLGFIDRAPVHPLPPGYQALRLPLA